MIVVDTSVLVALLDRQDVGHTEASAWYSRVDEPLATTPLVLAEVDYLARTRLRHAARPAFLRDVASGAYDVIWWSDAPRAIVEITDRYADLPLSVTDASLVALAARLETVAVATFDERHFRAVRPLSGATAFTLLPADAR